ncbi:MAG: DUF4395 family protein [bacterium]|nr:DUF4395 family protein [bacterium]
MQQCLIVYDNSLKFSRTTYGILALIAFLIQNPWLVLATSILMIFGAISVNYNFPYQLHSRVLRKMLKDKSEPIKKESGESSFAYGLAGSLLFIGFLFLYFGKFVGFAWGLILMVALLMLLAGIVGICVASLMYAFFKKIFKR